MNADHNEDEAFPPPPTLPLFLPPRSCLLQCPSLSSLTYQQLVQKEQQLNPCHTSTLMLDDGHVNHHVCLNQSFYQHTCGQPVYIAVEEVMSVMMMTIV